jgi:hypothetical protein
VCDWRKPQVRFITIGIFQSGDFHNVFVQNTAPSKYTQFISFAFLEQRQRFRPSDRASARENVTFSTCRHLSLSPCTFFHHKQRQHLSFVDKVDSLVRITTCERQLIVTKALIQIFPLAKPICCGDQKI